MDFPHILIARINPLQDPGGVGKIRPGDDRGRVHPTGVRAELPAGQINYVASSLGRYVFGSEISYNKPPPRLPGLGC